MLLFDPLTLVLIFVAAIIGWRLWSVLGQRTGMERQWPRQVDLPPKVIDGETDPQAVQPQEIPSENQVQPDTPLGQALTAITRRDKSFEPDAFLAGATRAYELINMHFAKGDKAGLTPLLSRDVMKDFTADIDRRNAASETMTWQLVKMESGKLQDASLNGNLARLTVHFTSSVISATTDKAGTIVEGHATAIEKVEDYWSFERQLTASDPNWKLVATTLE